MTKMAVAMQSPSFRALSFNTTTMNKNSTISSSKRLLSLLSSKKKKNTVVFSSIGNNNNNNNNNNNKSNTNGIGCYNNKNSRNNRTNIVCKATENEDEKDSTKMTSPSVKKDKKKKKGKSMDELSVDDINPISIGRNAREMFDGFFNQITSLTRLQKSTQASPGFDTSIYDMDLLSGDTTDMIDSNPQAKFTMVLVIGATGRVGKIIVRKLLLRGYGVRALIRREADKEILPPNVEAFVGDVSDLSKMREAVKGCSKVMYCARASSTVTADLYNVEVLGVQNACSAMQDYYHTLAARRAGQSLKSKKMLADFKWEQNFGDGEKSWTTEFSQSVSDSNLGWRSSSSVSAGGESTSSSSSSSSGSSSGVREARVKRQTVQKVQFERSEENSKFANWSGFVTPKTGVATLLSPDIKRLHADSTNKCIDLSLYEGLTIRYKCDAKKYQLCVIDSNGNLFRAAMRTKLGWKTQAIPWTRFVSEQVDDAGKSSMEVPQLDISKISQIGIRYSAKINSKTNLTIEDDLLAASNQFSLMLEHIKAHPRGEEADIVLVSCFGAGMEEGEEKQRVVKHKKDGECALRRSGLQYAIVRPSVLVEEPSGGKALVFDQGERLSQNISCADVADVCVKSLHDAEARNRTFDVAYDKGSEGDYELITQVVSKNSGNYLTPALQTFERNT